MRSNRLLKSIIIAALMITATPMSVIASETEHPDQISESSIAPSAAENSESGLPDANFVEADLMVQIHGEAIDSTLSTDLDWDCYTTIDKMTLEAGRVYQILIPCDRRNSTTTDENIWWLLHSPKLLDPDAPTDFDYFTMSVGWATNSYTGQVDISASSPIHLMYYSSTVDIYNADGKHLVSILAVKDAYNTLSTILNADVLPDAEQYYIGTRICSLDDAMIADLESHQAPNAKNSADGHNTQSSGNSVMTLVTIVSSVVGISIILAIIYIRKN